MKAGFVDKTMIAGANESLEFTEQKSKLSPVSRARLEEMQAQVAKEMEIYNEAMFSADTFVKENALRNWIRTFTGNNTLNISDAEQLLGLARKYDGTPFEFDGRLLIVTPSGRIDYLHRYVYTLELTIIDQHRHIEKYDNAGFFTLIKLAFKRLFRRN